MQTALKLIPVFKGVGSEENHAFKNSCDFALQYIEFTSTKAFVKRITTRLTDKAYRAIKYKEIKTFKDL